MTSKDVATRVWRVPAGGRSHAGLGAGVPSFLHARAASSRMFHSNCRFYSTSFSSRFRQVVKTVLHQKHTTTRNFNNGSIVLLFTHRRMNERITERATERKQVMSEGQGKT